MDNKAIEKITSTPIVYNVTEEGLTAIENKWAVVPDCDTKEGYKLAKAGISEVKSIRTSVEKRRKELKSEALQYGKNVDFAAKEITARLVAIEEPMKEAKVKVDTAKAAAEALELEKEKKRVLSIRGAIDAISNTANVPFGATMYDIKMSLVGIENELVTEEKYQEFTEKALAAKTSTVAKLTAMIEEAAINEAKERELKEESDRVAAEQAAEKEKLRAESEAFEKKKLEERAAFEAKITAEREEREAEERESAAKRAEEQAKLDAERAEVEAEKEAMRMEKERAEQQARAEQEAKEEAERLEMERIEKEEIAEENQERLRIDLEDMVNELNCTLVDWAANSGADISADTLYLLSETIVHGNLEDVEYKGGN